jgi:glutamate synthase domain-containing protein 1
MDLDAGRQPRGRKRTMCGIAGLRLKTRRLEGSLGELVTPMLEILASRGPDSTGVAIYRRDRHPGAIKYSLRARGEDVDWERVGKNLSSGLGVAVEMEQRGPDAVAVCSADPTRLLQTLTATEPHVGLLGHGETVEVYKAVGGAGQMCRRYGIAAATGYQAVGHTRMATESAVTTEHSHPFVVASDLSLVHNGSFSNYATVRRRLVAEGAVFDTDNDSEVAARFVAAEMRRGFDLADALRGVLKIFDGFFALLVATRTEFAVVRDSFACKPMVVAETDDYVAVASEYVALAHLPSIETARVFEPAPEELCRWQT